MRFGFRQMKNEDISVFIDEMFEILASNMSAVAPTGNSYDEDYKTCRKAQYLHGAKESAV